MFKKSLVSTAVLALTSSLAIAGTMGSAKAPCDKYAYKAGPYVGFSVGPRVMMSGSPLQYIGAEGTLSAGYGHLWSQWFYLAGEVFGGNSVRLKNTGFEQISAVDIVQNVRTRWSYGFDAIPGIMINERTLGYVRGGVVNTEFQIRSNEVHNAPTHSVVKTTHPTGWRTGAGIQTNVYKDLDVRLEYIYNQFDRQHSPQWGHPYMNMFDLGIVYRFV